MSLESKVGAFVVAGLVLMGTAIFLLGDYTLEKRYQIYVLFRDVANLSKNAPVKLSGVEIGQVRDIVLVDSMARCVLSIRKGVDIYKDAEFTIGSTGIIGSKYLQIDQGKAASGVIPPESTITGLDPVDIQKALTKTLNSLTGILNDLQAPGPRGTLTNNIKDTMANVREMTANLNDLLEETKPKMARAMERTDDITLKLDQLLAKANTMMEALATNKGAVGSLLHDEKVKEDVKETVASVKEAASTAKDMLGRMNQYRIFWNYDWRYESQIKSGHTDIGLFIYPRENRYYYVGGSNLGNLSDTNRHGTNYAQPNRIDALLGFKRGPFDLGVGVIRSGGGGRLTVTPFYKDPLGKRFSVVLQAYDFGRNRIVESRRFDKPVYDVGVMARVTRWLGLGVRAEDLATTKRGQIWANLMFEDKDIASLFGVATFGASGTRGRSSSK